MSADPAEISVKGVLPTANGCAVFLGNDEKTFIIYVDHFVGNVIHLTLTGAKKERPLTHDLIGHIFTGLDVRLDHVLINDMNEGTFFARILLRMENELGRKLIEIDARPSDSIVLALQQHCPLHVSRNVLDRVEDMTEVLERVLTQQAAGPPPETDDDDDLPAADPDAEDDEDEDEDNAPDEDDDKENDEAPPDENDA
ncbi:MAG: bifunctional nuclease family protein [Opitutaceae bacterium]|jgi:bifunctional DNase/RNase|nr:bifunctional nuclease family protein [Opitutaceae bacterium]